jgi:predicted nucleic acid-binding protein
VYLIDTNVISEVRKGPNANAGVIDFFRINATNQFFLSVQTVGEIQRGIENVLRRGDQVHAGRLAAWLAQIIDEYADRIIVFDADCARVWGRLMSPQGANPIDKQIAAIALIHGLDVVTRNVDDFQSTGVHVLNPFR